MMDKINAFFESARDTGTKLKEKASEVKMATKDSVVNAIEKWLEEFPKIESYGLRVSNFAFVMSLSPSLQVELEGDQTSFPPERLDAIIAENKPSSLTGMIFSSVKTTFKLHRKISQAPGETLIIKIRLGFSPEISVFIGEPKIN